MDGKIVGNCIDGRKRIDKIIIAENILKLNCLCFLKNLSFLQRKGKQKKKKNLNIWCKQQLNISTIYGHLLHKNWKFNIIVDRIGEFHIFSHEENVFFQ